MKLHTDLFSAGVSEIQQKQETESSEKKLVYVKASP